MFCHLKAFLTVQLALITISTWLRLVFQTVQLTRRTSHKQNKNFDSLETKILIIYRFRSHTYIIMKNIYRKLISIGFSFFKAQLHYVRHPSDRNQQKQLASSNNDVCLTIQKNWQICRVAIKHTVLLSSSQFCFHVFLSITQTGGVNSSYQLPVSDRIKIDILILTSNWSGLFAILKTFT